MAKYFNSETQQLAPIPSATYYVIANDNTFSGWGHAKGKINTVVVPIKAVQDIEPVIKYMEARQDLTHIRVVESSKGQTIRAKTNTLYSLCPKWVEFATKRSQ